MIKSYNRIFTCIILVLAGLPFQKGIAQNKAIGSWTNYLNFNNGRSITDGDDYTFVAFQSAIAALRKSDNSIQYISKINGLNDVDIKLIRYDHYHHVLIIAYTDGNIDIWAGFNKVTNVPDINLKSSIGDNNIYSISVTSQYIYFSCGFGIVVYDPATSFITDTYKPGNNGSDVKVSSTVVYNDTIYAVTPTGLWYAPAANTNLFDYSQWHTVSARKVFSGTNVQNVVTSQNALWVFAADTVFSYSTGKWSVRHSSQNMTFSNSQSSSSYTVFVVDSNKQVQCSIWAFDNVSGALWYISPGQLGPTADALGVAANTIWSTDNWIGWRINTPQGYQVKALPGPFTNESFGIKAYNGTLHVAGGLVNSAWNHGFRQNGFYEYNPSTGWINYNFVSKSALANYQDFICVAVNPANERKVYYGSFNKGLIEKTDTSITNRWDNTNSTIGRSLGDPNSVRVSGLLFDNAGNLWVANHDAANPISVYTSAHQWVQMLSASNYGTNLLGGPMAQDNAGQIWLISEYGGGVVVYNYNNDISNTSKHNTWRGTTGIGKGNLPNSLVYCLAVDKDGYIWLGTATGVCVFYCPEQVMSGGCDAQQVIYTVPQDGHLGYLLATEEVLSVAVDGANRKWFGTRSAGVFLMSADGTQQLQNFTTTNSPLLSNTVTGITVDNKTGEVFFATDKGIISYLGDANEGDDAMSKVYVTPDPVRPTYNGNIIVRGVASNSTVKIADVTGNLVWETKSQGGLALWDGNRLDGNRAASGVYLVYVISADGLTTATTKFVMLK